MVYENTGNVPNVMTTTGGDDKHGWYGIWAIVIVIIFFALIMVWRRDGNENHKGGYGELLPALALANGGAFKGNGGADFAEHCAMIRDNGDIKKEIVGAAWAQTREADRYFYEQRAAIDRTNYDTLLGFKQSEVLGLQNKGEILGRIDGLERRLDQDIIAKQSAELTYLKTIQGVRGLGMVPAVPYAQYPIHCNDPYSYAPAV